MKIRVAFDLLVAAGMTYALLRDWQHWGGHHLTWMTVFYAAVLVGTLDNLMGR